MSATIGEETIEHDRVQLRGLPVRVTVFLLAISVLFQADAALAYRPLPTNDAAVADPGEMEVELQPAGARSSEGQKTLIAPATVINYGFAKNWEAVLEGRLETPLPTSGPTSFTDGGLFLKHILRPGVCCKTKTGPSIATEFGVLLPDSIGDTRPLAPSIAGIVSQRWDWGTATFERRGSANTRSACRPFHRNYSSRGPTNGPCAQLLNFSMRKNSATYARSRH